ncbi:NAD(P)H-binding protein [Microlunatus speluncae]|uniref:NAD(P)H-binding protein n=1 Tax=Microlunatus speluncae TaxID=2594267 RepID=UPI0012666609|nr:NAD(P)H-binding protein [Microlunatus speluncae]
MTILVAGATGTVGRRVVDALLARGATVRALTRDPASAGLPPGVETVAGNLADPSTLATAFKGVTAAHLIGFDGPRGAGGGEALATGPELLRQAQEAGVTRVTLLQNGHSGPMEDAVQTGPLPWTIIAPVGFMANTLQWAPAIRAGEAVREAFGGTATAMIHEADIAEVTAAALIEDGHAAQTYLLSGPAALTVPEQLGVLGDALGRPIDYVELTEAEAIADWRAQGMDQESIDFFVEMGKTTPWVGRTPLPTVERVTGHPARSFAQWAKEHTADFS